ncbi:endolytic transglycosylase MltG [Bhargavaea massiliensis]|uniref:endolytic transglycosylase MltG n=1 Tax=Bhargavaea massiliensis TaxID=2697500 RepID=UPI001BCE3F0E|nr:endolytic transglycosylase MltG [Bhargavaea massiliensis]
MSDRSKKQIMLERMNEKKKEVKTVRRIVLIVFLSVLLLMVIGGTILYSYVTGALKPVDPDAEDTVTVEIPIGSNLDSIALKLEEAGVIKNDRIFKYYAKFNNESDFQAGTYEMSQAMTPDELLQSLKTGKVYREPVFQYTIPEGLNLAQISEVIEKNTEYTADEFMKLVTDEAYINELISKFPNLLTEEVLDEQIKFPLEGYLFPATYPVFEEQPTLEALVEQMIGATDETLSPYREAIAEDERTVHQVLTMASLVEEEARTPEDRKSIASVFENRLEEGMPLQTDPTVAYAHGKHLERTMYSDLEIDDAYNTYQNKGLPPGPISNAGSSSIDAALNPSDTDYLYFLADPSGINHFAKTYEEHLQNRDKYLKSGE